MLLLIGWHKLTLNIYLIWQIPMVHTQQCTDHITYLAMPFSLYTGYKKSKRNFWTNSHTIEAIDTLCVWERLYVCVWVWGGCTVSNAGLDAKKVFKFNNLKTQWLKILSTAAEEAAYTCKGRELSNSSIPNRNIAWYRTSAKWCLVEICRKQSFAVEHSSESVFKDPQLATSNNGLSHGQGLERDTAAGHTLAAVAAAAG